MMNYVFALPHVNAFLNTTSGLFLIAGYVMIRRGKVHAHRAFMIAAFSASTLFLISYITYHSLLAYYLHRGPTRFLGEGLVRPFYFVLLTSHTILAVLITPFIVTTLYRGLRGQFGRHRRIARWTFPVWLYVSITGVLVYLMLYQIYPAP
jgi:putative membrane protein